MDEVQAPARELPAGLSEGDLKKLTLKNGPLFPITVEKDGERYTGLFKKPTLAIMGAAASAGVGDPLKSGKVIYANCKVHVPDAMDQDEEVQLAAINGVSKLFRVLEAEVGEPYV